MIIIQLKCDSLFTIISIHSYLFFDSVGEVAYETGVANLTSVPGLPGTYCADIDLDPSKYNDVTPIHAVAAVDWTGVNAGPDTYTANAVQTRVNGTVLTLCVYIVGGNGGRSSVPKAMWFTFQDNLKYRTNGTIDGGNIPFSTSATSTTVCAKLEVRLEFLFVSICIEKI